MKKLVLPAVLLAATAGAIASPQAEKLDRGGIAVKTSSGVVPPAGRSRVMRL